MDSVGGEEVPRERIWAELKETILKTDAQLREEETNNETKWEERGRGEGITIFSLGVSFKLFFIFICIIISMETRPSQTR